MQSYFLDDGSMVFSESKTTLIVQLLQNYPHIVIDRSVHFNLIIGSDLGGSKPGLLFTKVVSLLCIQI